MTHRVRWIAPATASVVVLGAGSLVVQGAVDRRSPGLTLWASGDATLLWIVGLALCVASAAAPRPRNALLLAIIAVAWASPAYATWVGGPGAVVAAAPALAVLAGPALWQLLLEGTARLGRARHFAVGGVWVIGAIGSLVLLLVRDPFLDLRCRGACEPNPFLITALPRMVSAAHIALDSAALALGVAAVFWASACALRGCRILALAPTPALVVAGIAGAASSMALGGRVDAVRVHEWLMAGALALLAAVAIGQSVAALVRATQLRRLANDLSLGTRGELRQLLATALGRRDLEVLYPLDNGRWVDASGVDHDPPSGRRTADLRREGKPIAMVVGLGEGSAGLETIGAAARLAIDNERLRAGISANLRDLRAARLRLVEAGDDERRRIERNLHDGMQQSLLVLQYELGLAATRAADPSDREAFGRMREEAHRITERLRETAHGVFPAALDDLGVDAALQRLAEDAPFPLDIVGSTGPRPPRPIERTVYLVAKAALASRTTDSSRMTITVSRAGEALVVRTGNGTTQPSPTLRDRVDALGGRIVTRRDGLEVELPCASS